MKLSKIICLLLALHISMQAQIVNKPEEKFITANVEASNRVIDNSILDMYTPDEISIGNLVIPRHTKFTAYVSLNYGRAFLRVSSIKVGNEIHTVDWKVVGPDFKEGIPFIETDRGLEVYEDQRLTFKATSY